MSSQTLALILGVVLVTALTTASVFFVLGMLWMRHLRRSMDRLHDTLADTLTGGASREARPLEGELVARFRVAEGGKTVSILQRGGRRFLEVEGELTHAERDQLLRYLRSEGFIE